MPSRSDDRATGVFGTTWGFTVFLVFLLFTVQLLFGLYARTTVSAVATDVSQDAANEGAGLLREGRRAHWEAEAKRRLGRYGDDVDVSVAVIDDDGDGSPDTVTTHVDARLPTFLPTRWIPGSPTRIERTMRARFETFDDT